jgi:hypothetical protein
MWYSGRTPIKCPACDVALDLAAIAETGSFDCQSCGTALLLKMKGEWIYLLVSLTLASAVAYVQGLESIVFAGGVLLCGLVAQLALHALSWQLGLPKKVVPVPPVIQTLGVGSRKL